jgi:hypothetical protein
MRATIHLLSAADYLRFRTTLQPALSASMNGIVQARKADLDVKAVAAAAEHLFKQRPYTFAELRTVLAQTFPGLDDRSLGYVSRMCVPLVMVPDGSESGYTGSTFTAAETWLDKRIDPEDHADELVVRYLAAFGPATVRDAQSWSGVSKLEPVFQRLKPKLQVFEDERKRELFDLPEAPRPDEETPVPVRFVAAYDNLILAHADRTRIIDDSYRSLLNTANLQIPATILVDGFVAGVWVFAAAKKQTKITIIPFQRISRKDRAELEKEGTKLAEFLAGGNTKVDVVFEATAAPASSSNK